MWWQPRTDYESALRAQVDTLVELYRAHLSGVATSNAEESQFDGGGRLQLLYGVGSHVVDDGVDWAPALLVDPRSSPVANSYFQAEQQAALDAGAVLPRRPMLADAAEGNSALGALARSWPTAVLASTYLYPSLPPRPAAIVGGGNPPHPLLVERLESLRRSKEKAPFISSGDIIYSPSRNENSTLGLPGNVVLLARPTDKHGVGMPLDPAAERALEQRWHMTYPSRTCFTTSGHGVGDPEELILVGRNALGRHRPGDPVGQVAFRVQPNQTPWPAGGWDLALVLRHGDSYNLSITYDDADRQLECAPMYPLHPPPQLPCDHLACRAFTGLSGRPLGTVAGALVQLGDSKLQWANCWMLRPSGIVQPGDSGAIIVSVPGGPVSFKVFGHIVAGAPSLAGGGFAFQWAQDLASVVKSGQVPINLGRTRGYV